MYSCIHATGMGVVGQISGVSEPPPDNAYMYFYVYLIFCRHVLCSSNRFNYQPSGAAGPRTHRQAAAEDRCCRALIYT